MKREEVLDKVAELVADQFEIAKEKVTGDLNFKADLDADSIDFVELILELEDAFNANISDDEAENLATVNEAVDYIMAHQND